MKEDSILFARADAVVMLTFSDWFTEPVSNRYHYATRFSKHLKVYFVQADLGHRNAYIQKTEYDNIVVVHVYRMAGIFQYQQLEYILLRNKVCKPIFWIYNFYFADYLENKNELKIFHATEDILNFQEDFALEAKPYLIKLLGNIDLLVAVSEKVEKSYRTLGCEYKSIILENGVDFRFWGLDEREQQRKVIQAKTNTIIYEGNVNYRLDYKLICDIADKLPSWEIRLVGRTDNIERVKRILSAYSNIKYYGELDIKSVRDLCISSSVGIIPFVQNTLMKNSLPLKTYEYMATGLSVVSIPIDGLQGNEPYISFADNADGFVSAIMKAGQHNDEKNIKNKVSMAAEHDYDRRFEVLLEEINRLLNKKKDNNSKKILILYDEASNHVFAVKNYLESFARYSKNHITYENATNHAECRNGKMDKYDVVVIFWSIRVCVRGYLSSAYEKELIDYKGKKILFVQDDYDNTIETKRFIKRCDIGVVLSIVPDSSIDKAYPARTFPNTFFLSVLTGYISEEMKHYKVKNISERNIYIGYRGRETGRWYGDLGQDKLNIGIQVKEEMNKRNIKTDIEWDDAHRIYTDKWLDWMASLKATLAIQSGSNVFDEYGKIKRRILLIKRLFSKMTYKQIHWLFMKRRERRIKAEILSPKMLEAISLKTALIMFEGNYSGGLLKPGKHFIELKRDYSNLDEIISLLKNDDEIQRKVDFAYDVVINDYLLSYEWLISYFDFIVESRFPINKNLINKNKRLSVKMDIQNRMTQRIARMKRG